MDMDVFMERLRSPAEAKLWLQKRGISIQDFARAHNLDAATYYQILDGRKKVCAAKLITLRSDSVSKRTLAENLCVLPVRSISLTVQDSISGRSHKVSLRASVEACVQHPVTT
ncbi:hypothetical protein [Pseudomonas congelans]|uniref:hypothetical protein n=1 Tax=Pseudomonas congelans TaxID=200452 RepID=UPI002E369ADE|nr:hypothetical protein [Pseudomonas congelans]